MKPLVSFLVCCVLTAAGCSIQKRGTVDVAKLEAKIKRFAPAVITGDTSTLSIGDRQALLKLIAAARVMDKIYTRQVWSGNEALRKKLEEDTSPEGRLLFRYFAINMSPWSKLDHDEPFVDGVPQQRPPYANYYPEDMTKDEFTQWLATLPESEQTRATGFFTTVRRNRDRTLTLIPYNEEYKDLLIPAAQLLKEAAGLTDNASLRTYLLKRADAFLSNDYYESDVAWMELNSPVDVTIGPYEVYMDELFNYKAAFEAFITLRNNEETAKLSNFSAQLQDIENHLPIDPRYRNPKLGGMAPISVVDEIAIGGEARAGVQTAAFNLPNDERITTEKGSKRVMLRNVQEAKFRQILQPIATLVLQRDQQPLVAFEPFFTHILAHELMHGLGPHTITVQGKQTTVRHAMKELGSALEEAKADISGLFALQYLIDKRIVDKSTEESMYTTFLAGAFRTLRFGINDAHGKGMALQFNYLMDEGAFVYDEQQGTFRVDFAMVKPAVRKLTAEIMTIQARGAYDRAKALLDRYVVIRPAMQTMLDKLSSLPTDIEPQFPLAQ